MNIINMVLILVVAIYFIGAVFYFVRRSKEQKAFEQLQKSSVRLFFWERKFLQSFSVNQRYVKPGIYVSRVILFVVFGMITLKIGSIAVFISLSALVLVFANRKTEGLIEEAGINTIPELNSFLDSYIPGLASGLSNDQAMLKYINHKDDELLYDWWVNRDNPTHVINNQFKRIVEVYKMIKFNEDRGIEDSLPIIEQMQKDLNVKQEHYNDYKARMGEIQPILMSYYIFVPVLLFISLGQTRDYWFSIWGYVSAAALIVLFIGSQFMVFKIREGTIKIMF